MSNNQINIDSYNNNTYIKVLEYLYDNLSKIEQFLYNIGHTDQFQNIDYLTDYYNNIFSNKIINQHLDFKIDKIYKSLYLTNPGPQNKGNSYFHLTLLLKSEAIIWLDNIYENLLLRLVRFYKHLFSKIDNYFISLQTEQITKYKTILSEIKEETAIFLKYSDHREILDKREKLNPQHLSRIPFGGLFYIAHLDNIQSIIKKGILSHNLAHKNNYVKVDISNKEVNDRRNRIEPSLGGNIHDYAPLFIHPRNPTFYYWCMNENKDNLILIKVNPHILINENVAFSDGNAAIKSTHFYKDINDFNKLNWEIIKDNYWTNHPDGKRIKCSEVLVKEKIPLYYLTDLFVYSQSTLNKILPFFPNHLGIKSSINKALYF